MDTTVIISRGPRYDYEIYMFRVTREHSWITDVVVSGIDRERKIEDDNV